MTDIVWGFSGLSHDASLAVFKDGEIVFAAHSERYSRIKNDKYLNHDIVNDAMQFGSPSVIYFYENIYKKKMRQLVAGQFANIFSETPKHHLCQFGVVAPIRYAGHHESHAAGGYYTSPFEHASILCIDSIGEFETLTIWEGVGDQIYKRHRQVYPHSVGLWYSAMTKRIGLKPQEHEYILMGMAALGNPTRLKAKILNDFFETVPTEFTPILKFKHNLHRGCQWWAPYLTEEDHFDIAAATQSIFEDIATSLFKYIRRAYPSKNLVLMGGSALNCVANTAALDIFDNVWIMPNCGDSGSSVGAVLAKTKTRVTYQPFLGHDIPGDYPVEDIINQLLTKRVVGVAAGKAEFGPRALGNRSLIADPRGDDIKALVNTYKQREQFRPFAPAILEEYVSDYFDVPNGFTSPYMQFTVKCKYPTKFPAIVHYDGSSRVQTVGKSDGGMRELLEQWYAKTGCPMLLNTSLNIKSEPMVNSIKDARRWQAVYGIPVCLPRHTNANRHP